MARASAGSVPSPVPAKSTLPRFNFGAGPSVRRANSQDAKAVPRRANSRATRLSARARPSLRERHSASRARTQRLEQPDRERRSLLIPGLRRAFARLPGRSRSSNSAGKPGRCLRRVGDELADR